MYGWTPIAVWHIPGMMKLPSNTWVAGTEKDMCWLISEVKLAGWLLRGMAKTLPFPADTEGTSTSKKKKKGKTKGESYFITRS